ncbi:MAG: ThiF family adenylyltransferase [Candidatus Hodarchaeota archaeon]
MSDRYDRQLLLDNWDQTKLEQSTVTVVGLGALGTVAAASLAMAGVGNLILIDFDTIETSNLNRQLFFRPTDVGASKVTVSAQVLQEINPNINIETLDTPIEEAPKDQLKKSTVVVEGLDTFKVRRWVNSFIIEANIPLVSGGMYGFLGNVQVVIPNKSPCLECQSLIPEEELQKACTPFGEVRKQMRPEETTKEIIPSVSTVSFVIGGIMAQEAMKIILGLPSLKPFLFWDGKEGIFTAVPLSRREDCFVCSPRYQLKAIPIRSPVDQRMSDFVLQLQYSFNLGPDVSLLLQTSALKISDEKIGNIFKSGDVFRVVDPVLTSPLKFEIILD